MFTESSKQIGPEGERPEDFREAKTGPVEITPPPTPEVPKEAVTEAEEPNLGIEANEKPLETTQERKVEPERKETRGEEENLSPFQSAEPQITQLLEEHREPVRQASKIAHQTLKNAYNPKELLIMTSGRDMFVHELWARDWAYAAEASEDGTKKSLDESQVELWSRLMNSGNRLFQHQQADGTMPLRIEWVHHARQYVPLKGLLEPLWRLGQRLKGKPPIGFVDRPAPVAMYENTKGQLHVRDATALTVSAYLKLSRKMPIEKARPYLEQAWSQLGNAMDFSTVEPEIAHNWTSLREAMAHEKIMRNPLNGLVSGDSAQDWVDSIGEPRQGELALVNEENYDALRRMSVSAYELAHEQRRLGKEAEEKGDAVGSRGHYDKAQEYSAQSQVYKERAIDLKRNILEHLWNEKGGYMRARVKTEKGVVNQDDRFDTMANVLAITSGIVNAEQAARILQNMEKMLTPSGLYKNFDPPYPRSGLMLRYKIPGSVPDYHNRYCWPWVSGEVGRAYLVAAKWQKDPELKAKFQTKAAEVFAALSEVHAKNGTNYEVVDPVTGGPTGSKMKPSCGEFVGSAVSYIRLKRDLEAAGLLAPDKEISSQAQGGETLT